MDDNVVLAEAGPQERFGVGFNFAAGLPRSLGERGDAWILPVPSLPTARALSADDALTAARLGQGLWWRTFGLRAHVHLRPFQCRVTALFERADPTAHTSLAEVAATSERP